MPVNILLNNIEKYSGKYVATRSFGDKDALCSGDDPVEVYNEARKAGADDPVIFFVPEKDMAHIY